MTDTERRFVVAYEDGSLVTDCLLPINSARRIHSQLTIPRSRILECVDRAELERLRAELTLLDEVNNALRMLREDDYERYQCARKRAEAAEAKLTRLAETHRDLLSVIAESPLSATHRGNVA